MWLTVSVLSIVMFLCLVWTLGRGADVVHQLMDHNKIMNHKCC